MRKQEIAFVALLKACAKRKDLCRGSIVHADILKWGLLGKNSYVGNTLVSMYAKCGALAKAQHVFGEISARDVVSWSALILGYAQQGQCNDAFLCFEQMQGEGLLPNAVTFCSMLKACGSVGATDKGKRLHEEIARQGLLRNNIVLGNALMDMYAKCGVLLQAEQVLRELVLRDVVTWNTLISGYAHNGRGQRALDCFEQMRHEGFLPTAVTFICLLNACGSIGAIKKGTQIHEEIARQGLLGNNIALNNALVDMYTKCGVLVQAEKVLKELPIRDAVSWNTLIAGYIQQNQGQDALHCFKQMKRECLSPDVVTFVCVLKACGSIDAAEMGEMVYDEIVKQGLLEDNIVLGTALVDMYAKCGALVKARQVLEELSIQDVLSWNALIAGYAERAQGEEAWNCYKMMQLKNLSPDNVTFTCVLKSCWNIGAIVKGEQVHKEVLRQGLLGGNVVLGTALVDMYAKCGALAKAQQLHDELSVEDVVSWSALVAGYAQQGQCHDALICVEHMQRKGLSPNAVTFSCVLNACSHSGLVDAGQTYFVSMSAEFGLLPDLEHYTCMVDLFGRAGHLDKAISVIQRMPFSDCLAVWSALLGACRKWGDVRIGRWAFEHAVQVDKSDVAAYLCMANIYTAAGMHEEAKNIESMGGRNNAWKKPGCWRQIDVSGHDDFFLAEESMLLESCLPNFQWESRIINTEDEVFCGYCETSVLPNIKKGNFVVRDSTPCYDLKCDVNMIF